ncbi:LuxR C-terminal-related transcriptional regulator [Streptomyces sp. NPDC093595]|uniref:helix-turn-helix transcriptional regulator n=1 Tax=Streptomyces sp. NPDC093595 TaxID=3366045 RepID=UPI0037FAC7FC
MPARSADGSLPDTPPDPPVGGGSSHPRERPPGEPGAIEAAARSAYEALLGRRAQQDAAPADAAQDSVSTAQDSAHAAQDPAHAPQVTASTAPDDLPTAPVTLPADVRGWLAERRLLDERRGRVHSPQRALHDLLAEQRARVDRSVAELHRGMAAFEDVLRLLPGWQATSRETVEAEFFDDRARLRQRIEDLDTLCRKEVLGLRSTFPEQEVLERGLDFDLRMLDRGVELRLLVSARAARRTGAARYLAALREHGAQIRVATTVPLHLNVVDRAVTVMALGPTDDPDDTCGDVVLHSARLAECFARVFDHHWGIGRPTAADGKGVGRDGGTEDFSPREREVLAMLAAGAKDEAIARRLGCSERTLRRLLTALVAKLGAESRFAAGVQAARLGLLD